MNAKIFFIRLAGLVILAGLGWLVLMPLTVHLLLYLAVIPQELIDKAFGNELSIKAAYIWFACVVAGFISLFFKENWRLVLYLSPLVAPSLFAIIFTLIQK